MKAGATAIVCLIAGAAAAMAQEIAVEGELSLAARHFVHAGAFPGQPGAGASLLPEARIGARGELDFADFELELYARGDDRTGTGLVDIQKAYLTTGNDRVGLLLGSDIVFWGATESFNPTNIVNQNDRFSRVDETRKLGQPMISLGFGAGALGTMRFFGLFGFREPDLGRAGTRPRLPVVPDETHAIFQRPSDRVDFAFRNTNTLEFGNGSLDYAISLFSGTDRAPVILPGCANLAPPVTPATCNAVNADIRRAYESLAPGAGAPLVAQVLAAASPATRAFLFAGSSVGTLPYYREMQQVGLELAYASGNWVWKFEGAQRHTANETYIAAVAGVEYRWYDVFGGPGALTLIGEYTYDDRSSLQPATVFDDDVFLSLRYDFNNRLGTAATLSGLVDLGTDSRAWSFDLSSRLSDATAITFSAIRIDASDPADALTTLGRDDFFELRVSHFF